MDAAVRFSKIMDDKLKCKKNDIEKFSQELQRSRTS